MGWEQPGCKQPHLGAKGPHVCQAALQDHVLVWPGAAGVLVGMPAAACLIIHAFAALVLRGFLRGPLPLQAFSASSCQRPISLPCAWQLIGRAPS